MPQATEVKFVRRIMNESINPKSAVAFTVKDPGKGVLMRVRCVAWFAVLMFANLPALSLAQSPCPGIHVKILNIRNSSGTVACALFESPDGFPTEYLHSATNIMIIKVRKTQARCDFQNIPPGTYALAVIHDENMNGKLDTNWLGSQRKAMAFQTMQRPCSARLRSLPPASSMTGELWI